MCGSDTGSLVALRDLLQFVVEGGVQPAVEVMPIADINRAVDLTRRGEARYRIVLAV